MFTCKYLIALYIIVSCGVLYFSTVNSIASVLLGDDRIVYKRSVQLTFTSYVFRSSGSLLLLPDTKVLFTVNGTVPNLCPTATVGIVNVSPG